MRPNGQHRWITCLISVLCTLVFVGSLRAEEHANDARGDHERWYVLELQDKRAGWVHSAQKTDGDRITSTAKMKLEIKRGQAGVSLRFETEFVETAGGEPVSMHTYQQLGSIPMETKYTFGKDELVTETRQGKAEWTRSTSTPPAGEWMCPAEAARFIDEKLNAGEKDISLRTIDPMNGVTPFGVRMQLAGEENVEVFGKVVPAMKWSVTNDLVPGMTMTEYTDLSGVSVRSTANIGGLTLTTVLADKSLALAKTEPPELLMSTLVTPDKPIREPRELGRAVYVLRSEHGTMPDLPETGSQHVDRIDGASCRLTIDVDHPRPANENDAADERFHKASAMLDSNDAKVRELTEKALKDVSKDASTLDRVGVLRKFVHDYIEEKNLGVGFATASEVARTAAGDCTEHGVLLAALLRASGVPSRVVAGLLYVDEFEEARDVFGYHMWTQALVEIDGKPTWVDVDAVLPDERNCDATHIALAVAALDTPEVQNSMVELAPLLGGLQITVEALDNAEQGKTDEPAPAPAR